MHDYKTLRAIETRQILFDWHFYFYHYQTDTCLVIKKTVVIIDLPFLI